MFEEASRLVRGARVARNDRRRSKPAIGRDASESAAICEKRCPERANSRSASAGLKPASKKAPGTDRNSGSAKYIPDCVAAFGEQPGPLRSRVRFERARNLDRAAADIDGDPAAEIDAGEIVVARLGNVETVADEDERGVDPLGKRRAATDDQILRDAEDGLGPFRVQGDACGGRIEELLLELDPLVEALAPGGLQAEAAKALDDESGSAVVAGRAGLTALHRVRGERGHVGPPGGGAFGPRERSEIGGRASRKDEEEREKETHGAGQTRSAAPRFK
jgi:hypothetical protein